MQQGRGSGSPSFFGSILLIAAATTVILIAVLVAGVFIWLLPVLIVIWLINALYRISPPHK